MTNKFWILRPRYEEVPAWQSWPYDKYHGFLVSASSADLARKVADKKGGDENRDHNRPWLDSAKSSCVRLTASARTGVILSDFHAG